MYPGVEDVDIMFNSTYDILGYVAHVKKEDKIIIIFRYALFLFSKMLPLFLEGRITLLELESALAGGGSSVEGADSLP